METFLSEADLKKDNITKDIIDFLKENEVSFSFSDSIVYYNFPLFRDDENTLIVSKLLIISPSYGIINILPVSSVKISNPEELFDVIDQVHFNILSRLIRNKNLRKENTEINSLLNSFIYAPLLESSFASSGSKTKIIQNKKDLEEFLKSKKIFALSSSFCKELKATIEGSKGIIQPKKREINQKTPHSKGNIVARLEEEIALFDHEQKRAYMKVLQGPQRIRGLAGSGKTVVLAMKAAIIHLTYPEKDILFTYYTKSLHQHVKRLITRFYRIYNDRDPDWSHIHVIHAWGGITNQGVYYNACKKFNLTPLTFAEAVGSGEDPFDYVCKLLLRNIAITPMYDYALIDEGQDFAPSFIQLCAKLTRNNQFVWVYDEFQTIFQPNAPSPADIFGVNKDGIPKIEIDDIILYKCYRNPREILVCAHALGFGLYGDQIVQMLEKKSQWTDLGYKIIKGDFNEGSEVIIERPIENSLPFISESSTLREIVKIKVYESWNEELEGVITQIESDLKDGLKPDDILVIVVDDKNARIYLRSVANLLEKKNIQTNNLHSDDFGLRDFIISNRVTLSTVHKAKGNESYCVYLMGVDSLFVPSPNVRKRNILFTAMTRAKGWIRISGIGESAKRCEDEIQKALDNFPNLKFIYPSKEILRIIKRDLEEKDVKKLEIERKLEEIIDGLSPDEIRRLPDEVKRFINQRLSKKLKKTE